MTDTLSLTDAELLAVLRHARGRYGTTLAYLLETAAGLAAHGIRDRRIERLVALARRHALAPIAAHEAHLVDFVAPRRRLELADGGQACADAVGGMAVPLDEFRV